MKNYLIRLKTLRTERKLSQKQLAVDLKTTNSSICDWENGRSEPNIETLINIAKYFNVTTDYLLGLED